MKKPKTKAKPKPDQILVAYTKTLSALKPLNPDQQRRVLSAAMVLLDMKEGK